MIDAVSFDSSVEFWTTPTQIPDFPIVHLRIFEYTKDTSEYL